MEEDSFTDPQHNCLCHSSFWRSRYNHTINKLRDVIIQQYAQQIPKLICTCDTSSNSHISRPARYGNREEVIALWRNVTQQEFTSACDFFEEYIERQDPCEEFKGFLKSFYRKLRQKDLLGEQDSSAKRFLYILYKVIQHEDFSMITPPPQERTERPGYPEEVIHLASLRPQDVGIYIGRHGRRIRHVLLPRTKVTVRVNPANQNVEAAFTCPPGSREDMKKKLNHVAELVAESRRIHEARVEEYDRDQREIVEYEENMEAHLDEQLHVDNDDDEFDYANN